MSATQDVSEEDRWFTENEAELLKAAKARHQREKEEREGEEKNELKKLHWMKCPKCGSDMQAVQLEGIEVDKCTKCEGIYFDAGELDELLLAENDKKKSIFRKLVSPIFS